LFFAGQWHGRRGDRLDRVSRADAGVIAPDNTNSRAPGSMVLTLCLGGIIRAPCIGAAALGHVTHSTRLMRSPESNPRDAFSVSDVFTFSASESSSGPWP
jgi:hypothetical protein